MMEGSNVPFQPDGRPRSVHQRGWRQLIVSAAVIGAVFAMPAPAQDAALVAKAKAEGSLTWYTADTVLAAEELAKRFQEQYGVRVEVNRKTTLPLVQQFSTESSRGQSPADVITVIGMGSIAGVLGPKNLLQAYVPAGAAKLPAIYRVGDIAFAYSVSPMGVMYNTKLVNEKDAQILANYNGWLDPRFIGKMAITAPIGGTTAGNMLMMQTRQGVKFIESLAKGQKAVVYQTVATVADAVASGEQAIGVNVTPSVVSRAVEGAPIRFLFQDEWTYVVPAVSAISAKAPHPSASRLFAEWLMTPATQARHASISYWVPTLPGVQVKYPSADWLKQPKNPVAEKDPVAYEKEISGNVEKWRAILGW